MDGKSIPEMEPSKLAGQVGTVFQDPRSQFFMTDTTRDIHLGLASPQEVQTYTVLNFSFGILRFLPVYP